MTLAGINKKVFLLLLSVFCFSLYHSYLLVKSLYTFMRTSSLQSSPYIPAMETPFEQNKSFRARPNTYTAKIFIEPFQDSSDDETDASTSCFKVPAFLRAKFALLGTSSSSDSRINCCYPIYILLQGSLYSRDMKPMIKEPVAL